MHIEILTNGDVWIGEKPASRIRHWLQLTGIVAILAPLLFLPIDREAQLLLGGLLLVCCFYKLYRREIIISPKSNSVMIYRYFYRLISEQSHPLDCFDRVVIYHPWGGHGITTWAVGLSGKEFLQIAQFSAFHPGDERWTYLAKELGYGLNLPVAYADRYTMRGNWNKAEPPDWKKLHESIARNAETKPISLDNAGTHDEKLF